MGWVQLHLLLELLTIAHLNGPALIKASNEMSALDMIDAKLFPAVVQFNSVKRCFFTLDLSSSFEESSDQFLVDDSLRWLSHVYDLFNLIII